MDGSTRSNSYRLLELGECKPTIILQKKEIYFIGFDYYSRYNHPMKPAACMGLNPRIIPDQWQTIQAHL